MPQLSRNARTTRDTQFIAHVAFAYTCGDQAGRICIEVHAAVFVSRKKKCLFTFKAVGLGKVEFETALVILAKFNALQNGTRAKQSTVLVITVDETVIITSTLKASNIVFERTLADGTLMELFTLSPGD